MIQRSPFPYSLKFCLRSRKEDVNNRLLAEVTVTRI